VVLVATIAVDIPEELVLLLRQSRLGSRPAAEQVRVALAIHLFQEGIVSISRAAELAGEPRAAFELLLGELGVPPVRYNLAEYQREWEAIEQARQTRP